ncbi:MAG: hypothetical protein GEU28_12625 [Dehalococcoidia bacterium]|nr:hypothetical protein [Dehalococcoidia bacterium]
MTQAGLVTDERGLDQLTAEAEALIGVPLRRNVVRDLATAGTMHSFCKGIGNRNPLFLDQTPARSSVWGNLVAHPLYLYGVDDTYVAPGFAGYHSLYGEVDWGFSLPILEGTRIASKAAVERVDVVETAFAGATPRQRSVVEFADSQDRTLATARITMLRPSRAATLERGLYSALEKHRYTPDELDLVARSYDEEKIQGERPRYWDDVEVGEDLVPVVKGPLTSEDMLAFIRSIRPTRLFADAMQDMRRHPGAFFIDPEIGMPDSWEEVWFKDKVAQSCGFPAAHETGLQRVAWVGDLLTNWCSDHGFLARLQLRLTRPCINADSTWSMGRVAGKRREGEKYLVDLQVWAENQRGERTAEGVAEVLLPSRDPQSLPVPLQLGAGRDG